MFYQTFFHEILTYKHGIYELPQDLLNDLRLSILGNIRKVLKLSRSVLLHMETKVNLKYFVFGCL